ncbi:UNVERIFIED_CONTAM: hypothetical protein Slati_3599200 [Sesamum latifolium]|uniref:AB hydrolase-1 domain-containing protein n=1 Tax=Sesamum latifolium TaxID=2727402 RepID=A0AAW2TYF9_9LAMI
MAAGTTRKISAASARAHTRKPKPKSSSKVSVHAWIGPRIQMVMMIWNHGFDLGCGEIDEGWVVEENTVGWLCGFLAWAYQAARPPPPKTCGSADGPPVTASRVQLKDGRYLAYQEYGVAKDIAKHKIVFVHGFDSCRHDVAALTANLSPDIVESKGIYIVSFDRPGYGESDPHPTRTVKSLAFDIEDLADQLGLGSKFYVVGFSMGGQIVWTCLKYIPHRLAGAALLAPVVNYWWPGIPSNMSTEAYNLQPAQDQWAVRVAHYMPWLTYWWNTQKLFPASSVISHNPNVLSQQDKELTMKYFAVRKEYQALIRQQGEYESIHRDMMIGFGTWEFGPMDLKNPFSESEGSVHLWHGEDDLLVPVTLQRYIAHQLPWIKYHEISGAGHMFPAADGMSDKIIQELIS